jgi:hypothetical protein
VNPCHSRWKCLSALQTRASRKTRIVGKVYNICRVKTDISTVLTVKSGLDPHMIVELKDDLNQRSLFIYVISDIYLRVGIYLHLVNACLIKLDELKNAYHSQTISAFSLIIAFHVI